VTTQTLNPPQNHKSARALRAKLATCKRELLMPTDMPRVILGLVDVADANKATGSDAPCVGVYDLGRPYAMRVVRHAAVLDYSKAAPCNDDGEDVPAAEATAIRTEGRVVLYVD
jgi:hypothetical protein